MSSDHGSLIKNKNNMRAVRADLAAHPSLEGGVEEALQPVMDDVSDHQFQQLKWKEKYFKTGHVTSQSEVDDTFDEVLLNDNPKLNKDHLTTDALKKSPTTTW